MKPVAIAWLAVTLVAACAEPRSTSVMPRSTQTQRPGQVMPGLDPKSEIAQLDQVLEAERVKMGLPEPANVGRSCPDCPLAPAEPFSNPPSSQDPVCRPASNDACRDSCTLSDSICGNAQRICTLAQQLPGDAWAAEKCTSGKAVCEAAHDKCCHCQ
ncbi:MAG: hypothetical protein JWO36_6606 [Myxococcales bacterium]|nr:hypothetical protein [Myxococcales bacterium]